jgi:uncharacterized membrane protein
MGSNLRQISAAIAYVPVIGWIYVMLVAGKDEFARFHLRQSIGLVLFLAAVFAGWAGIAWLIAWIPYGSTVSVTLFTLVIAAFGYGVIAWVVGVMNALRGVMNPLPIFGLWAHYKLP